MATSTSFLPPLLRAPTSHHHLHLHLSPSPSPPHLRPAPPVSLLRAARRRHSDAVVVVPDARSWVGDLSGAASYRDGNKEDGEEAEEDEDEDDDRSLDLLARFLHAVFRKASRRARRAARSVLPPSVPAELVKFSVNCVLVLTFLWILKGLLEIKIHWFLRPDIGSAALVLLSAVQGHGHTPAGGCPQGVQWIDDSV